MDVRRYRPADDAQLIELWQDVLPHPAPHNDPQTSLKNKLAVDDLILVAERSRRIVGAVMGGYDGHRGWIYSLAVQPDCRRQGVGALLVRALERKLEAQGCLKVNLQVRASNAEVVAFYEHLGYNVEDNLSLGKRLYESP